MGYRQFCQRGGFFLSKLFWGRSPLRGQLPDDTELFFLQADFCNLSDLFRCCSIKLFLIKVSEIRIAAVKNTCADDGADMFQIFKLTKIFRALLCFFAPDFCCGNISVCNFFKFFSYALFKFAEFIRGGNCGYTGNAAAGERVAETSYAERQRIFQFKLAVHS